MLPESFTPEYLNQLELLRLRARRAFLGSRQGGHISPKRGHGIEFSEYRKYERGDNPRHIDWGVYARTERLYVKRFQEEQDVRVLVVVDPSASMSTPSDSNKWNMARDMALSVCYVASMQQDAVTLAVLGHGQSPPLYGGKAIHAASSYLENVTPDSSLDFTQALGRAASRVRFPGIAVVISDFLMPFAAIESGFNALRARNLDITAIQVLSPQDISPLEGIQEVIAVDSETQEQVELVLNESAREEYAYLLVEHNEKIKNFFLQNRIGYSLAVSSNTLSQVVQDSLTHTGLLT